MLRLPSRACSVMNTAVNPAVSRMATGIRAINSRFLALISAPCPPRDPGNRSRHALALLDVLDQRDGIGARAQLVAGHRVAALRGKRGGLDRRRVALRIEPDAQGQVI